MPILVIQLNGTPTNPYHRMGLRANPFTQLARSETDRYERILSELGADPIPPDRAEAYIREKLVGFSDELVNLCVSKYQPGKIVTFSVTFPNKE